MTEATVAVSPLRRRMIDDMSLRNLSPATQRSYLHAVTKFSRYFGRSPDRLGLEDVRAFQVQLVSQGISWRSGRKPHILRHICVMFAPSMQSCLEGQSCSFSFILTACERADRSTHHVTQAIAF